MRSTFRNARAVLAAAGLCAFVAVGAAAQTPSRDASPSSAAAPYGDVVWSELAYSAHKFFLGAATTIRVERVPASTVAAALRRTPAGDPVPIPSRASTAITVDTGLPFGRDESVRLFFDPSTGAALGGEKTTLGGSPYHKLFRYTEGGLFTWRSAPANDREAALPPVDWSRRKAYLVEPTLAPPPGAAVADSYALIYLVSAAHLDRRGDAVDLFMLADDRFVKTTFVAGGLTYSHVSFEEASPSGGRHREGNVLVRQVRVTAMALGASEPSEDVELGFLGMRGALTVYLEVGTDLPVALSGRVQHIGELTVRLKRAVLDRETQRDSR
jgi:hypothetical protein